MATNPIAKQYRLAREHVLRRSPDIDPDLLEEEIDQLLDDWRVESAQDRDLYGEPEDTPTVENCDDWGTGEGRYHGRI